VAAAGSSTESASAVAFGSSASATGIDRAAGLALADPADRGTLVAVLPQPAKAAITMPNASQLQHRK
jgi:hypothetical protein